MHSARITCRAQLGLQAPLVHVEVHLGPGLPTFSIVGLPATAVKESKERVRAALANANFEFPAGRITVNLAPADLPKEGGRFDLPIALGILLAMGELTPSKRVKDPPDLARYEFYGELALSGELKPVKGLLLAAAHAAHAKHELILPCANVQEAQMARPPRVYGACHLMEVVEHLRGSTSLAPGAAPLNAAWMSAPSAGMDLRDVHGQPLAKRALTVAAAGEHSLIMIGPPGSGKSMLAQRLAGLLPPLSEQQALEVATIASVSSGGFDARNFGRRPFRAPHHTVSTAALVGGGMRALPGEISLAHHGVLFLDELPEFDSAALEALREPLETGAIAISRVAFQAEYPARFQLIAAMNPCPCGYLGDSSGRCRCPPPLITRYRLKISGPLLDRIDLRVEVPAVKLEELAARPANGDSLEETSTAAVARRIQQARARQLQRAAKLNAHLTVKELSQYCRADRAGERLLWQSRARLGLSARGYHRTLRVARTIADLEECADICANHIAEALQLKRALESALED